MIWFVIVVMWIAIANLCVRCINDDRDMHKDWRDTPRLIKLIVLPFVPLGYVVVTAFEAFEK